MTDLPVGILDKFFSILNDGKALRCPICDDENLHIGEIRPVHPEEFDPKGKGFGALITFDGECGHGFGVLFVERKGNVARIDLIKQYQIKE